MEHEPREGEPAAVWERVDSLVPWDDNPRTEHDIAAIAESIETLGYASPIVCRLGGPRRIVIGHGRWEAMQVLGRPLIAVRWMQLTDEQASKLALADNRIAQSGKDDDELLRRILREVGGAPGFAASEWQVEQDLRTALAEPELAPVRDEFWICVRGPLLEQANALDALRTACPNVEIVAGVIRR